MRSNDSQKLMKKENRDLTVDDLIENVNDKYHTTRHDFFSDIWFSCSFSSFCQLRLSDPVLLDMVPYRLNLEAKKKPFFKKSTAKSTLKRVNVFFLLFICLYFSLGFLVFVLEINRNKKKGIKRK